MGNKPTSSSQLSLFDRGNPNGSSDSGLEAKLTQGRFVPAKFSPVNTLENYGIGFSRVNLNYSIEFDDKSNKTFYTREDGLSRLFYLRGSGLDSGYMNLADSKDNSLVVVLNTKINK